MKEEMLSAADSRRSFEEACMVSDAVESRQLWKQQFGGLRGFQKCWNRKYAKDDSGNVVAKPSEVVKVAGAVVTVETLDKLCIPEILYQDNQKHSSYSIISVKGGWTVVKYVIDGDIHTVEAMTEVEHKNFAVNRMINFIRMELKGK